MRIAIYHHLPSGGAKRAVYEWASRLVGEHTIDVYTLGSADHDFCDIRPFAQRHNVYHFAPRRLFESPFGRLNQLQRWLDLGDLSRLHRKIADEINLGDYDVLFANTDIYTFIPALLTFVRVPSVYYLHEPFGPGFERHFNRPYLQSTYWRKALDNFDPLIRLYRSQLESIQWDSVSNTGRLLANSKYTQKLIQAAFGVQAPVCPCGVDLDSFYPLEGEQKEDFVLSVGEMSPRKGFDFLVESLGEIPCGERPPLKIACNNVIPQEQAYVEGLASHYGVDLQVLTHLGTGELRQLYNHGRLLVYAPMLEPLGLLPLEAMACGTPVVGVQEGGVEESVIHEYNGLLVKRDPQQFGTAIHQLMDDPELASRYGRNGRTHVIQNWSWESSVSKLKSHLEGCACRVSQTGLSSRKA